MREDILIKREDVFIPKIYINKNEFKEPSFAMKEDNN
tara:strand:- start:721 stop:831 length:111 start_codon:yes stop_codon:yes gene_type:complete